MRTNERSDEALRPITITRHYTKYAEGAVLITWGDTQVLCTASIEEKVPEFLRGSGQGWITAEYAMLPRATHQRTYREKTLKAGRTQEIQRLIGRSLRAAINSAYLGERQIIIDCDVIQADGGTRAASITGSYIALCDAIAYLLDAGIITKTPIVNQVAAVSVGVLAQRHLLDLDYQEDARCDTDMNVVMNATGHFIEIQGTAEKVPFAPQQLQTMLALAQLGIKDLINIQEKALLGNRAIG